MSSEAVRADASRSNATLRLIPFSLVTFLGFLAVGVPLPVLPVYTQDRLGFGTIVVGIVVGAQSLATLLSRQFAGRVCDERGPKRVSLFGFASASAAGICYLISSALAATPLAALGVLIAGRLLLGFGESLFITALAAWSIARVGPANAGRAMAWSGIAMYGAIAIGAPIGSLIQQSRGFDAVALCTVILPLFGLLLSAFWADSPIEFRPRASFFGVLGRIWAPGLGMALASSGVGTISAFLALHYLAQGWSNVGAALAAFGGAYILVRLFFAGLPDRIGGSVTAMISLAIEAMGLLAIWTAGSPAAAIAGAALTGLGYSLVFPSLGVEALKRTPGENRGLVLGAYLACFDLGIAGAGPIAGIVAESFGLPAVFPAAAAAALLALALTALSRRRRA